MQFVAHDWEDQFDVVERHTYAGLSNSRVESFRHCLGFSGWSSNQNTPLSAQNRPTNPAQSRNTVPRSSGLFCEWMCFVWLPWVVVPDSVDDTTPKNPSVLRVTDSCSFFKNTCEVPIYSDSHPSHVPCVPCVYPTRRTSRSRGGPHNSRLGFHTHRPKLVSGPWNLKGKRSEGWEQQTTPDAHGVGGDAASECWMLLVTSDAGWRETTDAADVTSASYEATDASDQPNRLEPGLRFPKEEELFPKTILVQFGIYIYMCVYTYWLLYGFRWLFLHFVELLHGP